MYHCIMIDRAVRSRKNSTTASCGLGWFLASPVFPRHPTCSRDRGVVPTVLYGGTAYDLRGRRGKETPERPHRCGAMAHYWWRPTWWKFQKEFETWMVRQCRMRQQKLEERLEGLAGFTDGGLYPATPYVVNPKLRDVQRQRNRGLSVDLHTPHTF